MPNSFIYIHTNTCRYLCRQMRVLLLTGQQPFIKLNKYNIISMNYNIQTYNIEKKSPFQMWNVTIYNLLFFFYGLHFKTVKSELLLILTICFRLFNFLASILIDFLLHSLLSSEVQGPSFIINAVK